MPHISFKSLAAGLVVLGLAAPPVVAQQRHPNRGSQGSQGAQGGQAAPARPYEGHAVTRAPGPVAAPPPPRVVMPAPSQPAQTPAPRPQIAVPRGSVPPQVTRPPVPGTSPYAPHYEPRYQPHYEPRYQPHYEPRYSPRYTPHYYVPAYRSYYRPFARPYYSFRPRLHLGFGLWIGYPLAYPVYVNAYPYPYPSYSYPAYVAPGVVSPTSVGGLNFDITPPDAVVYIDGQYVGTVADFSPYRMPLTLTPGRHHVDIEANGFMPMSFDVDINPGEVIPYQGALQPW